MFVLGWQIASVHEQKLGAEQANAGRARLPHRRQIGRQFDIGMQFNGDAIERGGRGGFDARKLLPLQFPLVLLQPIFGQHGVVRLDNDDALHAVDNDQLVFANELARGMQRDNRWNCHAARQNRGVRG